MFWDEASARNLVSMDHIFFHFLLHDTVELCSDVKKNLNIEEYTPTATQADSVVQSLVQSMKN